jgi:rubrerythrin
MTMADTELANFLAHSVELESEARERYSELADSMTQHHSEEVAQFFQRMAHEASQHLAEVTGLAEGLVLPRLSAWEFDWPETEPPETVSYEAVHYRMSLRQAMQLALANECAAQAYYRNIADTSADPGVIQMATQFADEEMSHAAELEHLLQTQPANGEHGLEEDDDPHMPE